MHTLLLNAYVSHLIKITSCLKLRELTKSVPADSLGSFCVPTVNKHCHCLRFDIHPRCIMWCIVATAHRYNIYLLPFSSNVYVTATCSWFTAATDSTRVWPFSSWFTRPVPLPRRKSFWQTNMSTLNISDFIATSQRYVWHLQNEVEKISWWWWSWWSWW